MSKKHFIFFCFFFFCLTAVLSAWGRKEKAETKTADTKIIGAEKNAVDLIDKGETEAAIATLIQVTGLVRLVGNAPMSEIVITGQDKEWYVSWEEDRLLRELQYRTVTIEGYERVYELRFANGLYAGQRRTLEGIKIISIE